MRHLAEFLVRYTADLPGLGQGGAGASHHEADRSPATCGCRDGTDTRCSSRQEILRPQCYGIASVDTVTCANGQWRRNRRIWKSAELAGRRPVVNNLRDGSPHWVTPGPLRACRPHQDYAARPGSLAPAQGPARSGIPPTGVLLAAPADRHDHGRLVKKECISLAAARPSHICTYSGISVDLPGRREAASPFSCP